MNIDRYIKTFEEMIFSQTLFILIIILDEILKIFGQFQDYRNYSISFLVLLVYLAMYLLVEIFKKCNKNIVFLYYKMLFFQISSLFLLIIFTTEKHFKYRIENFFGLIILFIILELRHKVIKKYFKQNNTDRAIYLIYLLFLIFVEIVVFIILWINVLIQRENIMETVKIIDLIKFS